MDKENDCNMKTLAIFDMYEYICYVYLIMVVNDESEVVVRLCIVGNVTTDYHFISLVSFGHLVTLEDLVRCSCGLIVCFRSRTSLCTKIISSIVTSLLNSKPDMYSHVFHCH